MEKIIGVQTTFPEHRYSQKDIMSLLSKVWPEHAEVTERLTRTSGVSHRNLILPLERYESLGGFEERNGIYIENMVKLLHKSVLKLQEQIGFDWKDIALITSTSITGVAVPSLDARLMNLLPIPTNVIRTPLFGIGCLGGIASLNRAKDLLKAYPNKLALVLASEACSLTFQFNDVSMANIVACSLFGDGAAAVLLAGRDHALSQKGKIGIVDSMSAFYPNTERIMGWDMVDTGFKVVLSGNVPELVKNNVHSDVTQFLKANQMKLSDINNLISHPGGPKVLKALASVLEKDEELLSHSWKSLSEQGNMSSVSVLNVLQRSLEEGTLKKGYALGLAMGPAFNSELTLMKVD